MRIGIISIILLVGFIIDNECLAKDNDQQTEREYVKLIEEGKTWEYISQNVYWDHHYNAAFQMTFDGTEIRNGIEYHKFVYCGNITNWKASDWFGDERDIRWWENTPREISTYPNEMEDYFLMRESNGKVYLYIKNLTDGEIPEYNYWDMQEPILTQQNADEVLVYDFTKGLDETIANIPYTFNALLYPLYGRELTPNYQESLYLGDFFVKKISMIDLNGVEVLLQIIQEVGEDYLFDRYYCIEGVGFTESGVLPFLDCSPLLAGGRGYFVYLNCVTNANGEVIYRADGEEYHYVDVAKIIEMADMEAPGVAPFIERNGCEVKAENAEITLYDLSGRVVDSGFETVSTASLQPGVYIAKAQSPTGISTLKLKVD